MRKSPLQFAVMVTLAAGTVFAQASGSNSQPAGESGLAGRQDFMSRRLGELGLVFDLTDPQKEEARKIFEQAEQTAQPVRQESQQNLDELAAAAKAGMNETDIQRLAQEQGRLLGQLLAIRTQAWAKFYQMLTPEQRNKADQAPEQLGNKVPSGEHKKGP